MTDFDIYILLNYFLIILFSSSVSIVNTESDPLSSLETTIISHGGQVLRINDPLYKTAATLWNPAIQVWPSVILRPAILNDVSLALSTLSSSQIPVRIMGGRHSYGGYCSHRGVVLDSSRLKNLTINWQDETITVQAGVIWNEVYNALQGTEYVVIGGLCPSVGVVGFTLGGGYNSMYTRSFGLALDNVLNFSVALYNGTIVTASSNINSDLYWALRGGGGGNFGYVLEMTHKIHRLTQTKLPSGQISFFNITWENQDLKLALLNWLTFLKDVADHDTRISFDVIIFVSSERRFILMWGTFNGPQDELYSIFNPWVSKNPQPNTFSVLNYTQFDIITQLGTLINPFPVRERQHIVSAMAINITSAMLDVILELQPNSTEPIAQFMDIIYLNNANKDKNTAFPFADISFDIAPGFAWQKPETDYAAIDAAESWLQRLFNAAKPTKSIVGSYLNYIDPYLEDWQTMYYRNHWNRLREIKTKWDPTWYFRFPQGIPPIPQESNANPLNSGSFIFIIIFTIILVFSNF